MTMHQGIRLVIVTGMSGAGKTQAIKYLEDLGFFCVDNLPPALMPKMAELCLQSEGKVQRLALGIDTRGGQFFHRIQHSLDELEKMGFTYQILFMDASDETLVRRYKESRRRHPLAPHGRIVEGIRKEQKLLQELRGRATWIIDTSNLKVSDLRRELSALLTANSNEPGLHVSVVSFGFKYGSVMDADLVFDVRFLPNPHYVDDLKALTGEDKAVQDYVMKWSVTQQFWRRLTGLIGFLLPQYVAEGRTQLTIAVGCTGGQHRSVCLAIKLGEWLRERGYSCHVEHRDVPVRREEAPPEAAEGEDVPAAGDFESLDVPAAPEEAPPGDGSSQEGQE
ncbi:MAG TPA: RNase adapter RapZ [Symbiobacteriaceae bacterium]